ncbi:MAG: SapC family protein [Brevundimonas sp.]|uniref:SapC family protein n=1 Tax=Brevundimonas sp. TaxID=1871086 RepID=UPI0027323C59|nr:SapC family protein [Brevundimonas sp.]MDP3403336.1 SapC family protein [Brevundimonas sp.]
MTNIVLLNNVDHADLRVAPTHGPATGDAINQVLVFPTEFEALQREYVILFRRDAAGAFQSVALLGLDRDENLYLDPPEWRARYVPAVQRRGPFSIGLHGAEGAPDGRQARVNIDLDDPRVGTADGQAVFLKHGGSSPYLDAVNVALSTLYEGVQTAPALFEAFAEAGLLEPVEIDIHVGEGQRYDLDNVFAVRRDRLDALDGATLERLHRGGWLVPAVHAASSLGNLDRLIGMKNRKVGRA